MWQNGTYLNKLLLLFVIVLQFLTFAPISYAYTTNMSASVVVGQPNFSSISSNQGGSAAANTFASPYMAVVIQGKLVVSDYSNSRVLIYNTIPTTNNASADIVIGQTNLTNTSSNQGGSANANTLSYPWGLATDGTKLFIGDYDNNRVLIYNTLPTTNNASADVVIGQPNFTIVSGGTSEQDLQSPGGIAYDAASGKLFIADYGNHRVLIYNSVPTTHYATADVVLGQVDFTQGDENQGGSVSGSTMYNPYDVHVAQGKLFVADTRNNRILIWNSIPTTDGQSADVVIGQPSFVVNNANQGGSVAANTLNSPSDVAYDGRELFVLDSSNARILIYDSIPTSNNASATKVLSQPNFTSNDTNQGGSPAANTLSSSSDGSLYLYNNQLFVFDPFQNRLLIYNDDTPPTPTPTTSPGSQSSSSSSTSPPGCSSSRPSNAPQLFQVNMTHTTATLYFVSAQRPVTYHMLSYGLSPNAEQYGASLPISFSSGVEQYTINYLSPSTTYYIKLRGGNECMPGDWSNIMKVTTTRSAKQKKIFYR